MVISSVQQNENDKQHHNREPRTRKAFSFVGDTYKIIISGKQTDGTHAVIDMLIPLGAIK